jgi:hypothetical protein
MSTALATFKRTHGNATHQSDLCFARQRIRDVRDIVTTDSETKEQLIARVRELLQE